MNGRTENVIRLIAIVLLTGCSVGKYHRVVDPIEALQVCGERGVKSYAAMSGTLTCMEGK